VSLDDAIAAAVEAGVDRALARRSEPVEPLVFTVPAAAKALCTSPKTVRRLIAAGVLPTVPHMGARVLVPRWAVVALVESSRSPQEATS